LVIIISEGLVIASNIALHKPADQTGVWSNMLARNAVDGYQDNNTQTAPDYYRTVCAHPDNPLGVAQWWVDLESVYYIHTVTVYNTYDNGGM
jgi:hypothetical protein